MIFYLTLFSFIFIFPALPLEVNRLNKSQTVTAQRIDVDRKIEIDRNDKTEGEIFGRDIDEFKN